jgi:hypothetical protein
MQNRTKLKFLIKNKFEEGGHTSTWTMAVRNRKGAFEIP